MKGTAQSFIEEMAKHSPNINILGEYKNAHTKIECRCPKCGCEFLKAPNE